MLDEFIARKSKNESRMGARLDSVSDIIFVIVAIIKILPALNLSKGIIIWIVIIALIKVTNVICAYICYKKLVLPHTIANKIIGFILFIAPYIIVNTNQIMFEIIICSIATFASVQEGHYIRTGKENTNYLCKVQNCVKDLKQIIEYAKQNYEEIYLWACSMGSYCLLAYKDEDIKQCLFLSPVVNMKVIIDNMMLWSNITEK